MAVQAHAGMPMRVASRGEGLVNMVQQLPRECGTMLKSFRKLLPYISHIPALRGWRESKTRLPLY